MPTITTVDVSWETTSTLDAAELRRLDTAMFLGDGSNNGVRGGIVRHGDNSLAVSVNGSDQVTVQAGAVVIPAATGLGVYRASLSAATAATAIDSRNATNPRVDLVVFRSSGAVDIITGTPGASPSAPALPANAVELARLNVPAVGGGAVTVSNAFRQYATGLGGTIYVETAARLPGSGNQKGQRAVAIDTGVEHIWNGTAWLSTDWVNFTVGTPNLPLNAGSTYGIYKRLGKTVHVQFAAVVSGAGSGVVTFDLPVAAVIRFGGSNQAQAWGQAIATDASAASRKPLFIYCNNSASATFILPDGSNVATTTSPFTWESGDTLAGSFTYESA